MSTYIVNVIQCHVDYTKPSLVTLPCKQAVAWLTVTLIYLFLLFHTMSLVFIFTTIVLWHSQLVIFSVESDTTCLIDMTLFMTHLTLRVSESTYLAHTFPVTTVAFTLVALMSSSVNRHTHNWQNGNTSKRHIFSPRDIHCTFKTSCCLLPIKAFLYSLVINTT